MADACALIVDSPADTTLAAYESDRRLRQSVERSFEIIGEALLRLERTDPATAGRISDRRRIIGFHNRLVDGDDAIDNAQVWDASGRFLPLLKAEVEQLLREAARAEKPDAAGA